MTNKRHGLAGPKKTHKGTIQWAKSCPSLSVDAGRPPFDSTRCRGLFGPLIREYLHRWQRGIIILFKVGGESQSLIVL